MKNIATFLTALIVTTTWLTVDGTAQGFDWEWTPRSPLTMPNTYIGLEAVTGSTAYNGRLNYIEELSGFQCCSFSNGTGMPFRFSVAGETWVTPGIALLGNVGITTLSSQFKQRAKPVPRSDGSEVVTEYVFDNSLRYITLSAGSRVKLFSTHFSVGGLIRLHANIGNTASLIERVVSPSDYLFDTNPPSREYTHAPNAKLADVAGLLVEPTVFVSYDIGLSKGMYLQPMVLLSTQLNSVSSVYSWRFADIGVGLRFMKGLGQ